MSCLWFKNQRGSVLLFTIIMLMPLLVIGAIAMDLGYVGSVRREMQRSMDAAALAGAGNLGFDDTAFPAARAAAQNYAGLNGYSHYDPLMGDITLDLNDDPLNPNDPDGDIVLGVWEDGAFAPSLDGTVVNAVQCQFEAPIPTSFLSMLGLDNLNVSASAIAVSNPPLNAAEGTCVFPIALSDCTFEDAGAFSSIGCGAAATFITSNETSPDNPNGSNTAAWADVCGNGANANDMRIAVNAAADGGGCNDCSAEIGTTVETNNGMAQSVYDVVEDRFVEKFNAMVDAGETHTVTDSDGNIVYNGPGWKVFLPMIDTGDTCPPGPINQARPITSWVEMVMTQVINKGCCAVENPLDTNSWPLCPPEGPNPDGCGAIGNPAGADKVQSRRAIFGHYSCGLVDSVASRDPGPRSALGTKLRLVQ